MVIQHPSLGETEVPSEAMTMTSKEASDYLGISMNTLQKWRTRNYGPKYIKFGGANSAAVRYIRDDVIAFRDSHTIRTRGD